MTMDLNRHFHRFSLWFFVFFISLTIIYLPTLIIPFAHHDALTYFDHPQPKLFTKSPFHDITFYTGRYAAAYLGTVFSWFIYRIDDLKWLRLFNIFQLSLAGALIVQTVTRWVKQPFRNFLVTLTLFTLPSFQIFIAYSGVACYFPAIGLSLTAAVLAWETPVQRPFWKSLQHKKLLASSLLFLCAIMTYPSAAMFYWGTSLGFFLIHLKRKKRELPLRLFQVFFIGLSTIAVYAGLLKIMGKYFLQTFSQTTLYNPYSISTDYSGRWAWYLKEPLVNALNLWNIFPNTHWTVAVVLFLAGALVLKTHSLLKNRPLGPKNFLRLCGLPVLTICAFLVLSFLPNLLAPGQASWYRCTVGLSACVYVLMIWSGHIYTRYFLSKKRSWQNALLCLVCLAASYTASQTLLTYRVIPSYLETQTVIARIRQAQHSQQAVRHFHFIVPDRETMPVRYDEFGVLSAQYSFNIPSLINLAYLELDLPKPAHADDMLYSSSPTGQTFTVTPTMLVIDLSR